jgi:hypothetical protein
MCARAFGRNSGSLRCAACCLLRAQVLLQKQHFKEAAALLAACPCGVPLTAGGAAALADLCGRFGGDKAGADR